MKVLKVKSQGEIFRFRLDAIELPEVQRHLSTLGAGSAVLEDAMPLSEETLRAVAAKNEIIRVEIRPYEEPLSSNSGSEASPAMSPRFAESARSTEASLQAAEEAADWDPSAEELQRRQRQAHEQMQRQAHQQLHHLQQQQAHQQQWQEHVRHAQAAQRQAQQQIHEQVQQQVRHFHEHMQAAQQQFQAHQQHFQEHMREQVRRHQDAFQQLRNQVWPQNPQNATSLDAESWPLIALCT